LRKTKVKGTQHYTHGNGNHQHQEGQVNRLSPGEPDHLPQLGYNLANEPKPGTFGSSAMSHQTASNTSTLPHYFVSLCRVWLRQRGQYFLSSKRWVSFLLFLVEVYVLSLHSVQARWITTLASDFFAMSIQ
jgi:hypothetical protein